MSAHNHSPYNVEHPCNHENPPYYLSAYGLAVKLGFKGTEEEWLSALQGEPFTFEKFTEEQLAELIAKVAEKVKYEGGSVIPAAKVVALGAEAQSTIGGDGFGTCIVMHEKKNCLVFDLGNDYGATLKQYLDGNGIKTIDAIFVSHFHSDHYQLTTLRDLFGRYKVKSIVLPHTHGAIGNGNDSYLDRYAEAEAAAEEFGVTCCKPTAEGYAYTYGDFQVTCHNVCAAYAQAYYDWNYSELLYSQDENGNDKPPNYNNFSMVNVVTFAGHKIVVTGDIMEPAVANTIDVLSEAELIFVPHHGADIRIPPSAFNRLTAKHAVINACYDSDGYLKSVSRAFAGELLKKGCRVTTTYDGEMAGYCVGEEITPVEPGILAGNEIYPCGLMPEEDLDDLPDGEYITYSEAIAQTIVNAPPFSVRPLRKFKVKVETTYISDVGNRTQTVYTVDTATRPETARRNFSGGEYHDWTITGTEGQFYSIIHAPDDMNLQSVLVTAIEDMPEASYRNILLRFINKMNIGTGENCPQVGGHWHTEIFKQSENYAIVTAKSPILYGAAIQRVWFEGAWKPWEWVNPTMEEGKEYRTTERMNEKAIYRKLSDGKEYYRLDGETEWKLKDMAVPHVNDTDNPHGVTAAQIGAITREEFEEEILSQIPITDQDIAMAAVISHRNDTSNPHNINERLRPLDGNFSPEWELGTIGVADGKLSYSSSNFGVRTKEGMTYAVPANTTFKLSAYDDGEGNAITGAVFYSFDKGKTFTQYTLKASQPSFTIENDGIVAIRVYCSVTKLTTATISTLANLLVANIPNTRDAVNAMQPMVKADLNDTNLWELGGFDYADADYNSTTILRMKDFAPDDVELIHAEQDYAFIVAVYDAAGQRVGTWDGEKISKAESGLTSMTMRYFNLKGLVELYPGYKVRLMCRRYGNHTVSVENSEKIHFLNKIHKDAFYPRPTLTFIDDDANANALENWELVADEIGVKITSAVVTGTVGDETHATWEEIERLQNKGFEFISHTHGHINVTEKSDEACIADFKNSIAALKAHGCESRYLVYPYNEVTTEKVHLVRKYFTAAVTLGGTASFPNGRDNTLPLHTHWLRRYGTDTAYNEATGEKCQTLPLETLKGYINTAVINGSWLILMTHFRTDNRYYHDEASRQTIIDLCKYATEKGMAIQTFGEAFNRYKNVIENGNDVLNHTLKTHHIVDCNGVVWNRE